MPPRKFSNRAEEIVRETGTDAVVIVALRLNPSGGVDVEHGSYVSGACTSEGLAHVLEIVAENLRAEPDGVEAAEPS